MKQKSGYNNLTSIVLDTGLTFSSVMNKDPFQDIKITKEPIMMRTNVGERVIKQKGKISGLKTEIWYDENSIANIFSFKHIKDQYHNKTISTSKQSK